MCTAEITNLTLEAMLFDKYVTRVLNCNRAASSQTSNHLQVKAFSLGPGRSEHMSYPFKPYHLTVEHRAHGSRSPPNAGVSPRRTTVQISRYRPSPNQCQPLGEPRSEEPVSWRSNGGTVPESPL